MREQGLRKSILKTLFVLAAVSSPLPGQTESGLAQFICELRHHDREVVQRASERLVGIGEPAVAALVEFARKHPRDRRLRLRVLAILTNIGPKAVAAVPWLAALLSNENSHRAAKVLSAIGEASVDTLVAHLNRRGGLDRSLSALAVIGEDQARSRAATHYLGQQKQVAQSVAAARIWLQLTRTAEGKRRLAAAERLLAVSPHARGLRRWVRLAYVNLLPLTDFAALSVPEIDMLLAGADEDTRRRLMHAASGMSAKSDQMLPLIVDCLLDPEARVRAAALEALAQWGGAARAARGAITGMLQDPDAGVVRAAREALERVD